MWYVIDKTRGCIDSEWDDLLTASIRAKDLHEHGYITGVMTKPRVNGRPLDPNDPASWCEQGMQNPVFTEDTDDEEEGPLDDDLVTEDYRTFYQHGKPVLVVDERLDEYGMWREIERFMQASGFWPNVWFISDHGNAHQMMPPRKPIRQNPSAFPIVNEASANQALATYAMWHQKGPTKLFTISLGCEPGDAMCCVGKAHNIVYRSGKWEKGRKTNDYIHHFDSRPRVYVLRDAIENAAIENGIDGINTLTTDTTVEDLLGPARWSAAELAVPLSLGLDDGADGEDMNISKGARVYGAIDRKTIIIVDPVWRLIVIKGGKMYFDERGIVK